MSRIMVAPGVWQTVEPGRASIAQHTFALIGEMVPSKVTMFSTDSVTREKAAKRRQKAKDLR